MKKEINDLIDIIRKNEQEKKGKDEYIKELEIVNMEKDAKIVKLQNTINNSKLELQDTLKVI